MYGSFTSTHSQGVPDRDLRRRFTGWHTPRALVLATILGFAAAGCNSAQRFPKTPLAREDHPTGRVFAFDVDSDHKPDYWQRQDTTGRVVELRLDNNHDGTPDETVDLDGISPEHVPHLIIVLDGCPYDCVEEAYKEGALRLFRPPVRMISCFPANSDLALSQIWHVGPARFCEALCFDPQANRFNNGHVSYLRAENSPWVPRMAYRCSFLWDANAYLTPQLVFDHELRGIYRTFAKVGSGTSAGYTVGTAGLGTRGGKPAIRKYLEQVDRLCQQIVHERRGRVKLSVLADHGQGLKRCRRVSFRKYLTDNGYRLGKSLRSPRDAVTVEYGIVTYAAFFTKAPAELADVLRRHEAVELTFHKSGSHVVVMNRDARAVIARAGGGFRYDVRDGDPLKISPIIARLREQGRLNPDGVIDDRALFEATATHVYPDAVRRAWFAFNGLTRISPDVIASLYNGYSHGGAFFDLMIGGVSSTHGSIDQLSSTSFVLTMRGPLPPALRLEDALQALDEARPPAMCPLATRPISGS